MRRKPADRGGPRSVLHSSVDFIYSSASVVARARARMHSATRTRRARVRARARACERMRARRAPLSLSAHSSKCFANLHVHVSPFIHRKRFVRQHLEQRLTGPAVRPRKAAVAARAGQTLCIGERTMDPESGGVVAAKTGEPAAVGEKIAKKVHVRTQLLQVRYKFCSEVPETAVNANAYANCATSAARLARRRSRSPEAHG
eukprot:COSAG02_NODE_425_length_22574_cov_29.550300_2_plen_202_part_00